MRLFSKDKLEMIEQERIFYEGYREGLKDASNKWIKVTDYTPRWNYPVLVAIKKQVNMEYFWDYDVAQYQRRGREWSWARWSDGVEIKPVYWARILTPQEEEDGEIH